jgi:hypothetical protein
MKRPSPARKGRSLKWRKTRSSLRLVWIGFIDAGLVAAVNLKR